MSTSATPVVITPFSCSPDPTAVAVTPGWRNTVYKTRYAIEHRQGLAAILGDPGLGKSTILRYLHAQFSALPDRYRCTLIPTPNFKSDFAFLKKISTDLGMEPKRSMLAHQSAFEDFLVEEYSAGRNVVVFIDEAQKLDNEQLELVRTILNFETDKEKLIQVVLAANLDLRDRLLQKKHKPLASRIFAPSVLNTMTMDEMRAMLMKRCELEAIPWLFEDAAVRAVYDWCGGIPRLALKACEFAYAQSMDLGGPVTEEIMSAVVSELKIDGEQTA